MEAHHNFLLLILWIFVKTEMSNRVQVRKHIIDRRKRFDPFHLSQYMLVFDDVFIGGQQDVELPAAELRHKPTTQSRGALICGDKQETPFCRKKQKI